MRSLITRLLPMLSPERLGGQALFGFGLRLWGAVASFLFSLLITRSLGAAGSGYFAIAITSVTVVSYFVLCGLDYTVVRVAAGDLREGKRGEAWGAIRLAAIIILILGPVLAGLLWLLRQPFATDVLQQPQMANVLAIMAWAMIPLALQRIASGALRVMGRTVTSQLIDGPLGTTLTALAMAWAVLQGQAGSILVPVTLHLAGATLSCVLAWVLVRRTVSGWPKPVTPAALPLLAAGVPILLSNLSGIFTEWYTTVAIGMYWPVETVGLYRVAWQFVALASLVQVMMDTLVGPRIAAAGRVGDKAEIASIARKAMAVSVLLGAPLFLLFFTVPEWLMSIFGPEFRSGAVILQILALGQLARVASGPAGTILVMTGNQRWILAYSGLGVLLCVAFAALLIPRYGAVGAAWATTATMALRHMIAALIVDRVLGIKVFRRDGGGPAAS